MTKDKEKLAKGPGLLTDDERATIQKRKRRDVAGDAVRQAQGQSHHADRLETVRSFVAGVAHEFELLMADQHPGRWGEFETKLDAPSDALGKAATEYAGGGRLGEFLLALDAYRAELRRIVEGFGPRSSND